MMHLFWMIFWCLVIAFVLGALLGCFFCRLFGKSGVSEEDYNALKADLDACVKKRNELQAALDACRKRTGELEAELDACNKRSGNLDAQVAGFAGSVSADDYASLKANLDACRKQSADLNARIADLEKEREAMRTQVKSAISTAADSAAGALFGAGTAHGLMGTTSTAKKSKKDDLKKVWGIGPKMESLLNGDGIHTFAQLAAASVERLRGIIEAYGSAQLSRLANEETWAEQATIAARDDWDALKAYQDKLNWKEGGKT